MVVRNGYHLQRDVVTRAGAVTVTAPRVNVAEVLPLLYLHGLSSLDFAPALEQFLGTGAGLSAATVSATRASCGDDR